MTRFIRALVATILLLTFGASAWAGVPPIPPPTPFRLVVPAPYSTIDASLQNGQSVAAIVNGDSTGVSSIPTYYRFPYRLTSCLATQVVPGIHAVERDYDDTNSNYFADVTIQTGTIQRNGIAGLAGIKYPATPVLGRIMPTTRVKSIAGTAYPANDVDFRVHLLAADWTATGANRALISLYAASGQRSWRLYLNSTNKLVFGYSVDGTTEISVGSAGSTPTLTAGQAYWFRVTRVALTDTVVLQYGTDNRTWITLLSATGTALASNLFSATANYAFGARTSNLDMWANTTYYDVEIRDGIDGPIMNPQGIEQWQRADVNTDTSLVVGSPTLYMINASRVGANIAYLTDPSRFLKMIQPWDGAFVILNSSHNEFTDLGLTYTTSLDSWLTLLKARLPAASFLYVAQNPEISPANKIEEQTKRTRQGTFWAFRNGLQVADVNAAFLRSPLGLSALTQTDGIHPQDPAGNLLWANTMCAPFLGRIVGANDNYATPDRLAA
jgi:hypothetical protein